jgi:hypothetical protein
VRGSERHGRERRHGDASSYGGGDRLLFFALLRLPEAFLVLLAAGVALRRALHPSPSSPRLPEYRYPSVSFFVFIYRCPDFSMNR